MAEIKRTIDLVMERTRHLTLTDEEKTAQREEASRKRLRGWLSRCRDGVARWEDWPAMLEQIDGLEPSRAKALLIEELLGGLDLNADIREPVALYEQISGKEGSAIEQLSAEYRTALASISDAQVQMARSRLADNFDISGSAVAVNLDAFEPYRQQASQLAAAFSAKLQALQQRLLASFHP